MNEIRTVIPIGPGGVLSAAALASIASSLSIQSKTRRRRRYVLAQDPEPRDPRSATKRQILGGMTGKQARRRLKKMRRELVGTPPLRQRQ